MAEVVETLEKPEKTCMGWVGALLMSGVPAQVESINLIKRPL
jgi:hypothetical protein